MLSSSILDRLNPPQRDAVTHGEGPLLILAGAGSGKTGVITHRIAWLVSERGADPRDLVAVTFTNKAAGEMRERAERLLGSELTGAYLGTFHAFGLRILRANALAAGYPPTFVIYDSSDQQSLIRQAVKEKGLDDKQYPARQVLAWISKVKTALTDADEAEAGARGFNEKMLAQLYREYEERLRRSGAMDFDDLLVQVIRLFRRRPEIAERYAQRTRWLMVDEYQDTNPIQYALIKILSATHRNICAVGDEDQSIYAFRGADIRNILDFERDFPDARVVKLEQNYRSSGHILKAASAVIRHNASRHDKTLWTESGEGEKLKLRQLYDDRNEADFVIEDMLHRARRGGPSLEEMAILYRTNATSRLFEDRLMARNIPYRIVGGLRFYERKEIKDLLAWVRMLVHPESDQDFQRAASTPPRGIGQKTIQSITARAGEKQCSLVEATRSLLAEPGALSGRAVSALSAFMETLRDLGEMTEGVSTAAAVQSVIEAVDFIPHLQKAHPQDYESRAENIGALVSAAKEHDESGAPDGLAGFLDRVSLRSDTDDVQGAQGPSLMTVHSAKGLEFDAVYVVAVNEDLFPHPWSTSDPDGLEEERRLMYVAMTRARKHLTLTWARFRSQFGQVQLSRPSRFLGEIPVEVAEQREIGTPEPAPAQVRRPAPWTRERATPAAGLSTKSGELTYETDPDAAEGEGWAVGMRVQHPRFGPGLVMTVEGRGERTKLKIRFKNGSLKKILPAHTTLIRG